MEIPVHDGNKNRTPWAGGAAQGEKACREASEGGNQGTRQSREDGVNLHVFQALENTGGCRGSVTKPHFVQVQVIPFVETGGRCPGSQTTEPVAEWCQGWRSPAAPLAPGLQFRSD